MNVYIAGGWFNLLQLLAVRDIEAILDSVDIDYFSPRLDNEGVVGMSKEEWEYVYQHNLDELRECDVVIASTENKDMGTMFECGYAAALNRPVIYYAPNLTGKFNLMLAKSAWAVATSAGELHKLAREGFPKEEYTGGIE